MKNTEETLKEIERRYAFNHQMFTWWVAESKREEELHHIKKSKDYEQTADEYNDRNYELIMLYSFITGKDWLESSRYLNNTINTKRNAD